VSHLIVFFATVQKIDLAEMEGLGMATTIGEMEKAKKQKEELVVKDTALAERLSGEASSMFDTLISRLEQFKAAREGGAIPLTPAFASALQDIPAIVSRLGIPNGARLVDFVGTTNGAGHSTGPLSTDPPVGEDFRTNDVAPIGTPKAASKKMAAEATVLPKFTWAAASSKPAESGQKTSLLDIQKEELQSKTS
jgi:hypothetical protein